MNVLLALNIFYRLMKEVGIRTPKACKELILDLEAQLAKRNFSLDKSTRKRIYMYSTWSNAVTYSFSLLRGYSPNEQEQHDSLCLGALTPVADDLMDATGEALSWDDSDTEPENAREMLFEILKTKLKPLRQERPRFELYARKVEKAQANSMRQLSNKLSDSNLLERITYDKGGFTANLYRMVLRNDPLPGEEEMIYTLGAYFQVLDDLYDMYDDHAEGIRTLVTENSDMREVRNRMRSLERQFGSRLMHLDYETRNKRKAYTALMIIVTRGRIAQDYYIKKQAKSEKLDFNAFQREELIIDMDSWLLILRNFKETCMALERKNY